jgi:hypothetical protein
MMNVGLVASIRADLHNAHFRGEKDPPFLAKMFMPGYEAPKQDWRQLKALAQSVSRSLSQSEQEALALQPILFSERAARARVAQQAGASPAEVRLIMERG